MDILLTHGYFLFEDETEKRIMKPYPPLGILYLSSHLKMKGFDVKVLDTTFLTKPEFEVFITHHRPSIVGIYSNLMTKLNVLHQITICKHLGSAVIVGGPDVPEYAQQYIEHGADVAVIGEAEETLAELLPALVQGSSLESTAGIVYRRDDGTFYRTRPRGLVSDLDSLPLPDRDAIDIQQYVSTWKNHHGMGSVSLICARGCPYTCTWCSRSVFGESHRRRSVKNVVDEIEILRERYSPDMLWFADDVFTINHKWFGEFYNEMKRRGIRIPFECITRADRLNADILQKMSDLGAFRIWYGSESGSQRILDRMQRKVSTEQIRSVTKESRRYGIQTGLFVMLGYPGEELVDIDETVSHLKAAGADIVLTTLAYPIKGTEYFHEVEEQVEMATEWSKTTDRQTKIHGRYSDRFYWFANRYLINEVQHHRVRSEKTNRFPSLLSTYTKAKLARLGMELTKNERS